MFSFHPYADIFPLLEGEEFAALVDDIRTNDVREKIVVFDGAILDGRNRYRAALAAGVLDAEDDADRAKYFIRFLPEIDGDPLAFVISKNLQRRHLSDIQRASVAGKIATLRRGRPEINPPNGGISAEKAATTLNVAPRQVERARDRRLRSGRPHAQPHAGKAARHRRARSRQIRQQMGLAAQIDHRLRDYPARHCPRHNA